MKIVVLLFCMCSVVSLMAQDRESLQHLSDLSWSNRIIVIDINRVGYTRVEELRQNDHGIRDRDIYWFALSAEQLVSNYPAKIDPVFTDRLRAQLAERNSAVLLIGKDGGVKTASTEFDILQLFSQIDSMPMRRAEMKK